MVSNDFFAGLLAGLVVRAMFLVGVTRIERILLAGILALVIVQVLAGDYRGNAPS